MTIAVITALWLQIFSTNPDLLTQTEGLHFFDAAVLAELGPDYDIARSVANPRGEMIDIRRVRDSVVLVSALIDRNGRRGPRDPAVDTIVLSLNDLKSLPATLQMILARRELLPEDASERIGVTRRTTRRQ